MTATSTPFLSTSPKRHTPALILFLLALYFLFRLPNLTAQPIFCDEAGYLRWAQLIRTDPLHNYWVSMKDFKLPFHYWLLAIFYLPNSDPIYAGRLLSVLTGAAIIPLLFAIGTELQHLATFRNSPSTKSAAQLFPPLASAFMITSPLLAAYQTMALAEPLLLLQSITLAQLSLRLARTLAQNPQIKNQKSKIKNSLPIAIILGIVWATTLLTKQNFSYLLWFFPPLALALYATRQNVTALIKKSLLPLTLATTIGLASFIPAILSNNLTELKLKLFYKSNFFRVPGESRFQVFTENLTAMISPRVNKLPYWWPHNPLAPLDDGALYIYLTPPVFLFTIIGALWLLRRRAFIPLAFFGTWILILFGSVVANYSWIRTRYALLGIFPLILLAAWITAEFFTTLTTTQIKNQKSKIKNSLSRLLPATALIALLAWPLAATSAQLTSINAPTRTRTDRTEYLTRFSSGQSVQSVVKWLQHEASLHPITVITNTGFGTENDLVWLLLSNNKNVQLLAAESLPFSLPEFNPDGTQTFCTQQWFTDRTANLRLDPNRPTYTVQGLISNSDGNFVCNPQPNQLAPHAQLIQMFANLPTTPKEKPVYVNAIVQLNPPTSTPSLATAALSK